MEVLWSGVIIAQVILVQAARNLPADSSAEAIQVPRCIVSLIDDVQVPARAEGVLVDAIPVVDDRGEYLLKDGQPQYQQFRPQEGMEVRRGQPLLLIEDREAWKTYLAAKARLEGARMEAGNDISVRAARKAWEVSCVEVKQAEEANRRAPGSVPFLEMNRLYLQRDQLDLQRQKAEHELNLAQVAVKIREAEAEGAWLALQRHVIRSPVDGIIVEMYRDVGEWVKPGDAVMRVVRLDRVRVEGYLAVSDVHPAEVAGQPVEVRIATLPGSSGIGPTVGQQVFNGRVVFVNPLVEAGGRYLIWAEVENRQLEGQWILRPGLSADLTIKRKRLSALTSLPTPSPR